MKTNLNLPTSGLELNYAQMQKIEGGSGAGEFRNPIHSETPNIDTIGAGAIFGGSTTGGVAIGVKATTAIAAKYGAKKGAAIGLFGGPIGAVVGGAVGAGIGAVTGAVLGNGFLHIRENARARRAAGE
ncbi:MAG: hypothetical protein FWB72_02225 [Firmicutes bacterium]|nr:hypothetical protein [Bacillota bacterium]